MRNFITMIEALERGCPPATQDIELNLKNRQKAIDENNYGPLNPQMPNDDYWQQLADKWNTDDIDSVKNSRCGNCAAFDQTTKVLDCIEKGIGDIDSKATMEAGDMGYCQFLKFKCASLRTCDAWVVGGPITDDKK
jgi:hypothetical protein